MTPDQAAQRFGDPGTLGPPPDEVDIVDFSFDPPPIRFAADGDRFDGYPIIPVWSFQSLGKILAGGLKFDIDDPDSVQRIISKIADVFDVLLVPESAQIMRNRLTGADRARPLDLRRQVMPMLQYVMEQHGLRPTEQPSDSSAGSPSADAGTGSAAGASGTGSEPLT